jgi:hypothetical protein
MPSAMEVYHEKKVAMEAATEELTYLADKLSEVVNALTDNPIQLLTPEIRYPVEDDGRRRYPRETTSLDEMPEQNLIRAAISKQRDAETELEKAFAALSEIEKS